MPNVEVNIDLRALDGIRAAAMAAAYETAAALRTEIVAAQVTPRDQGRLEDSGGAIEQNEEGNEIHTTLCIGDTPYARRLYFHPEYNFQTVNNPNAQGRWADHWLEGGSEESFVPDTFRARMEAHME